MTLMSKILNTAGVKSLVVAAVICMGPLAASAAVVQVDDNVFTGDLSPEHTILTPIDLADGSFTFSGVTGGSTGGLTFDVFNSGSTAQSSGAIQILLSSASKIIIDTLNFGGISLLPLTPVIGGFATSFSAILPQTAPGTTFELGFNSANVGDAIQVTISPVPLPAGGLLLLTALGGVAALRRRRKAA